MEQLYYFRSNYDEEYLFKNRKEFMIFFKEWVADFFDHHSDYMPKEEEDFWITRLPIMTGQQAIEDCIEP